MKRLKVDLSHLIGSKHFQCTQFYKLNNTVLKIIDVHNECLIIDIVN